MCSVEAEEGEGEGVEVEVEVEVEEGAEVWEVEVAVPPEVVPELEAEAEAEVADRNHLIYPHRVATHLVEAESGHSGVDQRLVELQDEHCGDRTQHY